jgi:hypothetical protein
VDRGLGGLKSAKSFARQKHTLKKICTRTSSLIALSTVGAAFAQTASPNPTPAATQEDITRLEAQLKVAKLEAELAAAKGTPTPALPFSKTRRRNRSKSGSCRTSFAGSRRTTRSYATAALLPVSYGVGGKRQ